MAWCRQATSHYLSQCWRKYMMSLDQNDFKKLFMKRRPPVGFFLLAHSFSQSENTLCLLLSNKVHFILILSQSYLILQVSSVPCDRLVPCWGSFWGDFLQAFLKTSLVSPEMKEWHLIDALGQDRVISSAFRWRYHSLALSHRNNAT